MTFRIGSATFVLAPDSNGVGHDVEIGVFHVFPLSYIYIYIVRPGLTIFRVFRDSGHGTKIGVSTKTSKLVVRVRGTCKKCSLIGMAISWESPIFDETMETGHDQPSIL